MARINYFCRTKSKLIMWESYLTYIATQVFWKFPHMDINCMKMLPYRYVLISRLKEHSRFSIYLWIDHKTLFFVQSNSIRIIVSTFRYHDALHPHFSMLH